MKPLYKSKTVWLNIIALIIGIAPIVASSVKVLTPEQATAIDTILAAVVGVSNVVLRVFFTDVPIDTPLSRARRLDEME